MIIIMFINNSYYGPGDPPARSTPSVILYYIIFDYLGYIGYIGYIGHIGSLSLYIYIYIYK